MKIYQQIFKSYLNGDVIDSLKIDSNPPNKNNIIIETELVWKPSIIFSHDEDASSCIDRSNLQKIIIEIHEPNLINSVDELSVAEKLNGFQWKGLFKIHIRVIKVSFNDLFFTANVDKGRECYLAIKDLVYGSVIGNHAEQPIEDCNRSCLNHKLTQILLKKNNEWVDVNYQFPVIAKYLSKKDNTYALHTLREDLEGCKLNIIQKNALGILGGLTDSCDKAKKAFGIK